MKIVVAITGASGAIYARQVLEALVASECVGSIALIMSENGEAVAKWEGVDMPAHEKIRRMDNRDMFSPVASGSAAWDAMVVVPCSMGAVGRIASGVSSDLIARAADVMLKERRRLVLVPRETPFSTLHLNNMAALSAYGAVILPACPSFYSSPSTLEQAARTVTERILAHLGVGGEGYKWEGR